MDFGEIADAHTLEEFQKVGKFVNAQTPEWRERYAETNPIRIWTVAGPSADLAIALSAN